MQTKVCTKCDEEKNIEEFSVSKNKIQAWCKLCVRSYVKEKRNLYSPLDKKNKKLLEKYGIGISYYNILKTKQSGLCAICKNERELEVDHNHDNGIIRGLLCSSCNKLIGFANDDISILKSAIEYLEGHK
jgi:hypothetical protein